MAVNTADKDYNNNSLIGKKSIDNSYNLFPITLNEKEFDNNNGYYESIDINSKEQHLVLNSKTIYKIVEHGLHTKVYYIDEILGQICFGILNDSGIRPSKSIIDIIPRKITYFNNPIFPKAEPKVKLEFNNRLEDILKKIGPCNNINEILKILENGGYLLNKSKAPDAFNSIVSAMKENKGFV